MKLSAISYKLLVLLSFLASACNAASVEATATQTQEPTVTQEPTATVTETPSPTPAPLVEAFITVEGMLFHQLCENILTEYPQAGCPIVAHEDVPLDHQFMAFMDENGDLTGYGLDFGKDPWSQPHDEATAPGYGLDPTANPMWCGEEIGLACDSWLIFDELLGQQGWGVAVGYKGWGVMHLDDTSKEAFFTPTCECVLGIQWAAFPISSAYEDVIERTGIPTRVWR